MKIGGDVTPEKLAPFGIKTLVLSESCVQAGGRPQKADMNLLYDDELKLGKIFGKRQEATALVEGWKRRLAALPAVPAAVRRSRCSSMTRGGEAFHQRQIRYADGDRRSGGRPQRDGRLAGELDDGVREAVAAAEPDFIILLDYQTGSVPMRCGASSSPTR